MTEIMDLLYEGERIIPIWQSELEKYNSDIEYLRKKYSVSEMTFDQDCGLQFKIGGLNYSIDGYDDVLNDVGDLVHPESKARYFGMYFSARTNRYSRALKQFAESIGWEFLEYTEFGEFVFFRGDDGWITVPSDVEKVSDMTFEYFDE